MAKTPQERLIEIAMAEVGYLEKATNAQLDDPTANAGLKNWNKYARDLDALGDFYNGKKNGYNWCDVFVDWCFVQAFGKDLALKLLEAPLKSCGAGVNYSANYFKGDLYKNSGQFHTGTPAPGDQIFFGTATTWQHTGLVYAVDKTYVYTIEGNTTGASGVVANGGGVAKKKYKLTYSGIKGYGRPDWSLVGGTAESATVPTATVTTQAGTQAIKIASASARDAKLAKQYTVNATSGLWLRADAGTNAAKLKLMPHGLRVRCYGFYSMANGVKWLYLAVTDTRAQYAEYKGLLGFASSEYLN